MLQRKQRIILIILLLLSLGAGFLLGGEVKERSFQKEREHLAHLHFFEFEDLKDSGEPIYVIGHKSPDTDTVTTAIGLSQLLQALGYNAIAAIQGKPNKETQYVLEAAGIEIPELLEDASGKNIFLVDHSELSQTVDGIEEARLLGIMDHHGVGSISCADPLLYEARPVGSTATLLWTTYQTLGISIPSSTALCMMGGVLSDTSNLISSTTTWVDTEALSNLSALAHVSDVDAFYANMYQASLSYEGMTEEEILYSDYKEYQWGETSYAIGCINAYDEETARDLALRMSALLPETCSQKGLNMVFVKIGVFREDLSLCYMAASPGEGTKVLQTAFGEKAVLVDSLYRIENNLSRKKEIVPAIVEALNTLYGV